ncbi:MAG: hypothetical protein CM15mP113_1640 [Pseudomonadota bacterium]|nr:MAG: hypothetical protein CM15mP113_1640 [Pseudomonadota bacterium]
MYRTYHYAIFNDNVNIAILANKASTARDLLGRLQLAYENLPRWMQQGIIYLWNKGLFRNRKRFKNIC